MNLSPSISQLKTIIAKLSQHTGQHCAISHFRKFSNQTNLSSWTVTKGTTVLAILCTTSKMPTLFTYCKQLISGVTEAEEEQTSGFTTSKAITTCAPPLTQMKN